MNERTARREALKLTQTSAASEAGISLATWRRWEANPDSVSAKTREACERVLKDDSGVFRQLAEMAGNFERAWADSTAITPRQAYALALVLDLWADDIKEWLRGSFNDPLCEVIPFAYFDRRVMFYVDENRAWAAKTQERCEAVAKEIEHGALPFDRDGVYMDELLIAAALEPAEDYMQDMPELFDSIAPRVLTGNEDDDCLISDNDWDLVHEMFDDKCRWDEWEIPLMNDSVLLPLVVRDHHPFAWFDRTPPTGAGYLNRLVGLERPVPAGE